MQYEHTPEKIRAALTHIPADDRERWVRMGMALKNEYGDDGWSLFSEWSESAANYDSASAAATWKSCKASGGVTIATLLREAMAGGFDPKRFGPAPPLSSEEKARRDAERKQRELSDKAKQEAGRREAAAKAAELWEAAAESGSSPYLKRKGVEAHGVRFGRGCILVPLRDAAGQLWNLQRIYGKPLRDGNDKMFLPGGRMSGCYHLIGTPDAAGWLLVAEGYATAATLHQACGLPVVVAFNAFNLRYVAEAMRRLFPDVQLLICADDDRATEAETGKNPGLLAAKDAARRARAAMVKPEGLPEGGSDFNDLARASGAELVRKQLDAVMHPAPLADRGEADAPASAATPQAQAARDEREGAEGEGAGKPEKAATGRQSKRRPRVAGKPWFGVEDDGVWYHGYSDQGEPLPAYWICSRLDVTAETRDELGYGWGYLVEVTDREGRRKHWAMPYRLLVADGNEYRQTLADMGLKIAPGIKAKNLLTTYIQTAELDALVRCTERIGWHGGAFVLPDRTIGDAGGERVLFQSAVATVSQFKQRGTVAEWKQQVAALCVDNPMLTFAVSTAFAGPLLYHSGQHSGGFHFAGDSSVGKTTSLRVAASVFGGSDYMRTWRVTDNAVESVAAQHSGALRVLDEIAQAEPRQVGGVIYMLGNEAGKGRATRTATAKAVLTWRLLFLSSGEKTLSDHMLEVGQQAKAGQEVRMANIPAGAIRGQGAASGLHGFASSDAFSAHLGEVVSSYFGTAGMAFIEWVVANQVTLADDLRSGVRELVSDWLSAGKHSGQVSRVAARFALVGVAGDLATDAGLTGWPLGWARDAAQACFDAWLEDRGGAGNSEERTILQQVCQFFESHGAARSTWWHRLADDHAPVTMNRAGFRRMRTRHGEEISSNADHYKQFGDKMHPDDAAETQSDWFVLPEVFKKEVCKGFNHKTVSRLLIERGALVSEGASGRPDKKVKVPSIGPMRCYHITPALFDLDL